MDYLSLIKRKTDQTPIRVTNGKPAAGRLLTAGLNRGMDEGYSVTPFLKMEISR